MSSIISGAGIIAAVLIVECHQGSGMEVAMLALSVILCTQILGALWEGPGQ